MDKLPAPQDEPNWTWPEPSPTGTASPRPSEPPRPESLDSSSPPAQGGDSNRALAIRSSLITLTSTLISMATAFGLKLDEAQATALISVVTAVSALVSLLVSGRRRG